MEESSKERIRVPLSSFVSMATDDVLPPLQDFPADPSESASIAQIASSSAGQCRGQEKSNVGNDPVTVNLAEMMQKLFAVLKSKQQQLFNEFEDRQNSTLNRTVVNAITKQIHPLSVAIDADGAE